MNPFIKFPKLPGIPKPFFSFIPITIFNRRMKGAQFHTIDINEIMLMTTELTAGSKLLKRRRPFGIKRAGHNIPPKRKILNGYGNS